ncbi:Ubiquitin-like protein ATG12 [Trichoplax sp. H2]|uniref:Ubiquitin-like protein ATG12 n=1 Tax=Trichoplax adhaerens TaxID=10228 RepID=B3RQ28_TRIAD|nr:hypothetical protein TRIADDRAFT_53755 [Trichoplax adhaerens]EDV28282.1 hypothetical protein TRIADDRAFT_53755 [Trichoplax adhaerens]RDD39431.1 Ubiquitin-like protein ATG12 [Trichoplax sp. H2]|eukprot:XP_002110116.1 hypothetical protein TRIADDRAFT_53755 [Trichoplax adhaerens]
MADNEETAVPVESTTSVTGEKKKVDLLLKSAGDAPILKKKKWSVDPDKKVVWVIDFLRRYLKCQPSESLFIYVNQAFVPSADQSIRNLYQCFAADGKLVLYYCKTPAWG